MKTGHLVNIITDSVKSKFNFDCNKYVKLENADLELPTLIIGYEKAKQYIKNFDILKKSYPEQNLWWTFTKRERGIDYERDTQSFYNEAVQKYVDGLTYKNIDIYNLERKSIRKFLKWVDNDYIKYVYRDNHDFVYLYSNAYKIIYGISLTKCEFCGYNKDKIFKRLILNKKIIKIDNFDRIPYSVKRYINGDICKYMTLFRYFY
jgi:hypothetical protein